MNLKTALEIFKAQHFQISNCFETKLTISKQLEYDQSQLISIEISVDLDANIMQYDSIER